MRLCSAHRLEVLGRGSTRYDCEQSGTAAAVSECEDGWAVVYFGSGAFGAFTYVRLSSDCRHSLPVRLAVVSGLCLLRLRALLLAQRIAYHICTAMHHEVANVSQCSRCGCSRN